jgi:hypothetical protein
MVTRAEWLLSAGSGRSNILSRSFPQGVQTVCRKPNVEKRIMKSLYRIMAVMAVVLGFLFKLSLGWRLVDQAQDKPTPAAFGHIEKKPFDFFPPGR